jgi:hypothetical protein
MFANEIERGACGRIACSGFVLLLAVACSDSAKQPTKQAPLVSGDVGAAAVSGGAATGSTPSSGSAQQPTAGRSTTGNLPPSTAGVGAPGGQMPTTGSNVPPPPKAGSMAPPATGMQPPPMTPFTGPLDGDPSKPMVDVMGLKCGPPANAGFGGMPQTVKITDRDVVILYPCAHEGAAVTFFLFLHGTLQEAQKVSFTMNAFAIHELVDSHNVIVAVPKAIGTQWGNGDNGADAPHLKDVVNWVYTTFGTKFNIRSMWAQGGSWGAAYLAGVFACSPDYQDKLRGIQLIVGGGCPACANRMSCIVGQQELQLGNNMMLTPDMREMAVQSANIAPYAMQHGCGPKTGPTDVGNVKYWGFPNCQPGWAYSYYMAPGQHADAWDHAAVLKMTEEMKATEN